MLKTLLNLYIYNIVQNQLQYCSIENGELTLKKTTSIIIKL